MDARLIHILPEQVANQIAAGEVVERPASAVKELLENALDAGARTIEVEIESGGRGAIILADDGAGMSREDAILAVRRHATSKIREAADLSAIRTLGFRGEALASIASVSHLTIKTRRAADARGYELAIESGEVESIRETAIGCGTRIEVRDLFFNTPARLKFLKTMATEQGAIADTFQRLALANHKVAFRLSADRRALYDLPRTASTLERFRQLFGDKLAAQMLPFERDREGARVYGLSSQSQISLPTSRMLFAFVNQRAVRDRMLLRALSQAYQTMVPRGRYPAAVLFVEIGAEQVDVNVHPMKTEVRFRDSGALFELVYHAIRDRMADQRIPIAIAAGEAIDLRAPTKIASIGNSIGDQLSIGAPPAITASGGAIGEPAIVAPVREPSRESRLRLVPDLPANRPAQSPLGLGYGLRARPGGSNPDNSSNRSAAVLTHPAVPDYAKLRIVGQMFAGYIALEGPDGFMLVDQHAAHERVTFEKLRAQLRDGGVQIQALLTPETIELSPARAAAVHAAIAELRAIGFVLEPFGPATMLLKAAPAVFGTESGRRLLNDMIDGLGDVSARGGESAFEDRLKQLACHGSIRVGRILEPREIQALLAELDATEFKTNCPHGRPVHINFGRGQIERMFRR
ncbi:MAG: DNA mismatch repair endonuclease MutL [Candidatus Binataceae bacterium]|nr:DNA mismatch repair endonuclease MutL [Candidatus Binataceae bacterium]